MPGIARDARKRQAATQLKKLLAAGKSSRKQPFALRKIKKKRENRRALIVNRKLLILSKRHCQSIYN
jgi:hypothetical protein